MHDFGVGPSNAVLSFAVPTGVVVGAMIALLGVVLTNKAQQKREGKLRFWDKRSELYLQAFALVNDAEEFNLLLTPSHGSTPSDSFLVVRSLEVKDQVSKLRPGMMAFSTLQTRAIFVELGKRVAEMAALADEWQRTKVGEFDAVTQAIERASIISRELGDRMRIDLQA